MKLSEKELNKLINSINHKMHNYDDDIDLRMKMSDDLELKRKKQGVKQLKRDINELDEKYFGESDDELDLRKNEEVFTSLSSNQIKNKLLIKK